MISNLFIVCSESYYCFTRCSANTVLRFFRYWKMKLWLQYKSLTTSETSVKLLIIYVHCTVKVFNWFTLLVTLCFFNKHFSHLFRLQCNHTMFFFGDFIFFVSNERCFSPNANKQDVNTITYLYWLTLLSQSRYN